MKNIENKIFIRLFAEVETEDAALEILNQLISLLCDSHKIEKKYVKQYWKITEYYEIFVVYYSSEDLHKDYQNILHRLATGWEYLSEYDHIWNPKEDNKFYIENVKWGHVECEQI